MSDAPATIVFSHVEQVLLRKLRARRGDVAIRVLFCAAFGVADRDVPLSRNQQQRLGPRISVLNRKLEQSGTGERVVTGLTRRSYCLAPAGAWEMIPGQLKPTYRLIPARDRKTTAVAG